MILQYALALALPFALYFAYIYFGQRRKGGAEGGILALDRVPWTWLILAGLALGTLSLVGLLLFGGADPSQEYVPPKMIDGEIVPGHFE